MKVLYDEGLVKEVEPFKNLLTQGMVLKGGQAMSKSRGNVVAPDEIVDRYGADTARLFILFASPPEKDLEWSDAGVEGAFRFIMRVWRLVRSLRSQAGDAKETRSARAGVAEPAGAQLTGEEKELLRATHACIKRVTQDVRERFNFNTAVSAIMEMVNAGYAYLEAVPPRNRRKRVLREFLENLILLLAPFAPHVAEELWEAIGHKQSVHLQKWPTWKEEALFTETTTVVIEVNGRVRDRVEVSRNVTEEELKDLAVERPKVKPFLDGKEVVNVVYVPGRLLNIVVRQPII